MDSLHRYAEQIYLYAQRGQSEDPPPRSHRVRSPAVMSKAIRPSYLETLASIFKDAICEHPRLQKEMHRYACNYVGVPVNTVIGSPAGVTKADEPYSMSKWEIPNAMGTDAFEMGHYYLPEDDPRYEGYWEATTYYYQQLYQATYSGVCEAFQADPNRTLMMLTPEECIAVEAMRGKEII